MTWCVPGIAISVSNKFECGCTSTCSEQRISTQKVVHMYISSCLKEYDIIKASHGDMTVTWVVAYDISDVSIEGI